jgi:fructose-1,6-bisphosphatase/inositol monophosphatase family enzyme
LSGAAFSVAATLDRVAGLMRETAERELLARLGKLAQEEIREKRPGDLVTVADDASEAAITSGLRVIAPGIPVIGEEAVAADPNLLAHLDETGYAWLVDALDGTANFSRGRDAFAIIVCLLRSGVPVAGWILHPVSGALAMAEQGAGVTVDGARVHLGPPPELAAMSGFLGWRFLRRLGEDPARKIALERFARLGSLNCAGLEYLSMLTGLRHFMLYRSTRPWDHAAGALMMREAGGIADRLDTGPYTANQPATAGILSAPDQTSWDEIHRLLLG